MCKQRCVVKDAYMSGTGREFVDRLRAHLDANPELTPAGLAVKAGLDNSAIRSLLAGRAQAPRLETAMKICAALGTTIEEFMGTPRTEDERRILRALSQLPIEERQRLLGYADALVERLDPQRPDDPSPEGAP